MSVLFQPFSLHGLTLENRIVISPICQYLADNGQAVAWRRAHLGGLSLSGTGLLAIEATAVSPESRITNGCLGLQDDAAEAALERMLATIRQNALVPIGMQIAHAGRKASSTQPWEGGASLAFDANGQGTMGPSPLPQRPREHPPCEMTDADLTRVHDQFVDTAHRAVHLDLSAIELHAVHSYLLHEFLSPIANQRTDAFDGSHEDRMCYPPEVSDVVRAVVPNNVPVSMHVSATDWAKGSWTPEDSMTFTQTLRARGCDWIDASSGGVSPLQQTSLSTGYQVPFTEKIRNEVNIPTIAAGLTSEAHEAEVVVTQERTDLVAVGRAFLYNPHWVWAAAAELDAAAKVPPRCRCAFPRHAKNLFGDAHFGIR